MGNAFFGGANPAERQLHQQKLVTQQEVVPARPDPFGDVAPARLSPIPWILREPLTFSHANLPPHPKGIAPATLGPLGRL